MKCLKIFIAVVLLTAAIIKFAKPKMKEETPEDKIQDFISKLLNISKAFT